MIKISGFCYSLVVIFLFPLFIAGFTFDSFAEVEVEAVDEFSRLIKEPGLDQRSKLKQSSEIFLFLKQNPNFNLRTHLRVFDEFHASSLVEDFSSFLIQKKIDSFFEAKEPLEEITRIATQIYPQASPVIFKLNKIDSVYERSTGCIKQDDFFCFAEVVIAEYDNSYLNRLFEKITARYPGNTFSSFGNQIVYGIIASAHVHNADSGFCSGFFDSTVDEYPLYNKELTKNNLEVLVRLIEKNPACYQSLLEVLYSRTKFAIDKKNPIETANSLQAIRYIESSEEDFFQAKLYLFKNASSPLRALVREYFSFSLFKALSAGEKVSMMVFGFMPAKFYLLVLILLVFTPILFFVLYRVSDSMITVKDGIFSSIRQRQKEQKSSKYINTEELDNKPDEYTSLLAIFGLTDEASDADIKKAYRDIIKRLHPDAGNVIDQERLDGIQKAYDRLMELRRGWFGLSR